MIKACKSFTGQKIDGPIKEYPRVPLPKEQNYPFIPQLLKSIKINYPSIYKILFGETSPCTIWALFIAKSAVNSC